MPDTTGGKPMDEQLEDFESEAIERLEAFIDSMDGDRRFMIPADEVEDEMDVGENWSHIFTDRGSRLIERMQSRIYKLAVKKFGEKHADDMDFTTYQYQDL